MMNEINPARKTRVQKLGYENYNDYLTSPKWKERRAAFSLKYPPRCYVCDTTSYCQLHHTTYVNLGDEEDHDLEWLCEVHHEEVHDGGKVMLPKMNKLAQMKEQWLNKHVKGNSTFQLTPFVSNQNIKNRRRATRKAEKKERRVKALRTILVGQFKCNLNDLMSLSEEKLNAKLNGHRGAANAKKIEAKQALVRQQVPTVIHRKNNQYQECPQIKCICGLGFPKNEANRIPKKELDRAVEMIQRTYFCGLSVRSLTTEIVLEMINTEEEYLQTKEHGIDWIQLSRG